MLRFDDALKINKVDQFLATNEHQISHLLKRIVIGICPAPTSTVAGCISEVVGTSR